MECVRGGDLKTKGMAVDRRIALRAARMGDERSSTLTQLRQVIASVPRRKVITYGQVAAAGGFPGAARLTVWALQGDRGLPWQRVVAAGGRIALPGEQGQEQRLLLKIEGVTFRGGSVRMDLHSWTPRTRARRGGRASVMPSRRNRSPRRP
jgi:methylated-DNA-protein-cysteine methyltransferase-like protein